MSLFEDTNPRALKDLLGEINSRTTVLPDFQRDFVWDPAATQELIVSIANNYPAGSLLRVRDRRKAFAAREFEGAPKLNGHTHTFLVLDGQQRLTSLYQAFYGVGEHLYFLDLRKLLSGADFDESIFHVRSAAKYAKDLGKFEVQCKELILPLSVLKGGSGGFLQWLLQVTNPLPPEERTKLLDALTAINEQWIKTIDERDLIKGHSRQEQLDCKCIAEHVWMAPPGLAIFGPQVHRFEKPAQRSLPSFLCRVWIPIAAPKKIAWIRVRQGMHHLRNRGRDGHKNGNLGLVAIEQ